jgi:hypothetical protein
MSVAKSREEFEKAAQGLPFHPVDLAAEVVCIEPVDRAYFRDNAREQRCIIRLRGRLYVSTYD